VEDWCTVPAKEAGSCKIYHYHSLTVFHGQHGLSMPSAGMMKQGEGGFDYCCAQLCCGKKT
jgi:hypothetical protein